ncbi:MAG: anaerobic ribonucleoside-triphosphate reductase [Candidatus Bathyarchaeia archaeon]
MTMTQAFRRRAGVRVFSASSSPIRLEILRLLHLRGPMTYSEIMQKMGLDPEKQTGRFAYHLRSVQRARLVEADRRTRKYRLTEMGVKLVEFAQELDEDALKKAGRLLVRTSRLAIEEFERGRIVKALVDEAQMPLDLAEQVAREVEDRLLGLEVRYLTAPLIREIVNAVLIEKGLEEYRHRLTRLGLPVHDVTKLIQAKSEAGLNSEAVREEAADSVLREYVLLKALPRQVADAHLSGRIHIENLGTYILKPDYALLQLPQLVAEGSNRVAQGLSAIPFEPSRSLRSALRRLSKALEAFRPEVNAGQSLDMFNVWLAPYARGTSDEDLEEALREFLIDLAKLSAGPDLAGGLAIGLELEIPKGIVEERAGKALGSWGEHEDEARRVATALLKALNPGPACVPLFDTVPILKLRSRMSATRWDEPFQLAHRLASHAGTVLFANLTGGAENRAYTPDGACFPSAGNGEFGRPYVGGVVLDLPRIACLSRGDEGAFEAELESSVSLALEALAVRHRALYERIKGNLLPFLFGGNGEAPCRFDEVVMAVSFVGLDEATVLQTGNHIHETSSSSSFAEHCLRSMARLLSDRSKEVGEEVVLTQIAGAEAAERLAKLDYEEHGQVAAGGRTGPRAPYYTSVTVLPLEADIPLSDRLTAEAALSSHSRGGHLTLLEVDEEVDKDAMMTATAKIIEKYAVGLFAYSRLVTWCARCRLRMTGLVKRCPNCGSSAGLTTYGRASTRYLPLRHWTGARLAALNTRRRYSAEELSGI